ncbi:hypothetical protein NA57DRAFT_58323 [Rhizodiscina lignyota]|uniref:Uncharacterized protein n=1 Tax=Rhizodiscina lignyota TaxID=1504668 RepID=A0A9P4ID84_9PEZI|nr:hypothetical protein NA57DRAFT_58323 [Rhizodiscina lignyota]
MDRRSSETLQFDISNSPRREHIELEERTTPSRSTASARHSRPSGAHHNIRPPPGHTQRIQRRDLHSPQPSQSSVSSSFHPRPGAQQVHHPPDHAQQWSFDSIDHEDVSEEEHEPSLRRLSLDSVGSAKIRRVGAVREHIRERQDLRQQESPNGDRESTKLDNDDNQEQHSCGRCRRRHRWSHEHEELGCPRCRRRHQLHHIPEGKYYCAPHQSWRHQRKEVSHDDRRTHRRSGEFHSRSRQDNAESRRTVPTRTFSSKIGEWFSSLKHGFDLNRRSQMGSRRRHRREQSSLKGDGRLSRLGINFLTPFGGYNPSSERVPYPSSGSAVNVSSRPRINQPGERMRGPPGHDSSTEAERMAERESRTRGQRRAHKVQHGGTGVSSNRRKFKNRTAHHSVEEVTSSEITPLHNNLSNEVAKVPPLRQHHDGESGKHSRRPSDPTRENLRRFLREQEGPSPPPPRRFPSAAMQGLYSPTYQEEREQAADRRRRERASALPHELLDPGRMEGERSPSASEYTEITQLSASDQGLATRPATEHSLRRTQGHRRHTLSDSNLVWIDPLRSDSEVAVIDGGWPRAKVTHEQRQSFFMQNA